MKKFLLAFGLLITTMGCADQDDMFGRGERVYYEDRPAIIHSKSSVPMRYFVVYKNQDNSTTILRTHQYSLVKEKMYDDLMEFLENTRND